MAFKLVGGFPDNFTLEGTVTAGTAIAAGDVLVINSNVLAQGAASATIHTIVGVAAETITTADTKIKYIPITQGQIWEAPTLNDTASTQLYESCILDGCTTVNNTSTDVTGPTGVALIVGILGAVSDKRVLVELTRLQSTST